MAKPSPASLQPAVSCRVCHQSIPNGEGFPYPTHAVWKDGKWLCWECHRAAGRIESAK